MLDTVDHPKDALDLDDLSPWWPDTPNPGAVRPSEAAVEGRRITSGLVVHRLRNWPTESIVREAIEWSPAAETVLREWQAICSAAVDEAAAAKLAADNERHDWLAVETSRLAALELKYVDNTTTAASMRVRRMDLSRLDVDALRPWQAHVVDDACSVASLAHAVPGDAYVSIATTTFRLVGHGDGGRPILERLDEDEHPRLARLVRSLALETCPLEWRHTAFLRHSRRRYAETRGSRPIALTVLAMAREGHRKVFLKTVMPKGGTWTLDLGDVRDLETAAAAVQRSVGPSVTIGAHLVVQEHLPFAYEQRFFVVEGRIAASVCSARPLSAVDAAPGRILDPRVARLVVPEIDRGSYDRGVTAAVEDRALSARFARFARKVVRDLREEGLLDYVLDVGQTVSGALAAVELNALRQSGPYCLDRRLTVDAASRTRRRVLAVNGIDPDRHGALSELASGLRVRSSAAYPSAAGSGRNDYLIPSKPSDDDWIQGDATEPDLAGVNDPQGRMIAALMTGWTAAFDLRFWSNGEVDAASARITGFLGPEDESDHSAGINLVFLLSRRDPTVESLVFEPCTPVRPKSIEEPRTLFYRDNVGRTLHAHLETDRQGRIFLVATSTDEEGVEKRFDREVAGFVAAPNFTTSTFSGVITTIGSGPIGLAVLERGQA